MTSTPNSSFDIVENRNGKTAHNVIGRRKSKRTPVPIMVNLFSYFFIFILINIYLDNSRNDRRNCNVFVTL